MLLLKRPKLFPTILPDNDERESHYKEVQIGHKKQKP